MLKRIGLILAVILTVFEASGAHEPTLKRKASIGIRFEVLTETRAEQLNLEKVEGLLVVEVLEGSTADVMGLIQNDIITYMDELRMLTINDLINRIGKKREGDEIRLKIVRNGKQMEKKAIVQGRPKEVSEIANVKYGSVKYKDNHLRTILHLPKKKEKPPVVYFLQGYPCQSVDLAYFPNTPTRKLIDDWVEAGFAVFRVEKPGMGDSESEKSCMDIGFQEEVEAFRNGYQSLLNNDEIDQGNIFLFGHSIGGIIAPVLANEFKPQGIITYGTVIQPWYDYLVELTHVQGDMFGRPKDSVRQDLMLLEPFWKELLIEQKTPRELIKNSDFNEMLKSEGILETFSQGIFTDRNYRYWVEIQELNLSEAWKKVKSSVLALYGEFDIQALNSNHIFEIERTVQKRGKQNVDAKVVENADHGFVRFESLQENVSTLNNGTYGQYSRNNYHEGIAELTKNWMRKQIDL